MSDRIEQLLQGMVANGLAPQSSPVGCSEAEIVELEKGVGFRFPDTYRSFLAAAGRSAGPLFAGTDAFIPQLQPLRDAADALLKQNGLPSPLPQDAFVFSMHQGYEFLFFKAHDGEDPPVYQYVEGGPPPRVQWQHFSGFIAESIEQVHRARSHSFQRRT